METTESAQKSSRLEVAVAILIAAVTVVGAVVAWRASVAADGAGDADFDGLRASLNAEEARALNFVNAYEHYSLYVAYARHTRLADALGGELEQRTDLTDQEAFLLQRQQAEAYDLGQSNQELFPNRFLNRDGSYSVQREIGETWADAAKEKDVNPDPHYAKADQLRIKMNLLLGTLSLLALGLVFYTLVEAAGGRWRVIMFGLGSVCSVVGALAAVVIDFTR